MVDLEHGGTLLKSQILNFSGSTAWRNTDEVHSSPKQTRPFKFSLCNSDTVQEGSALPRGTLAGSQPRQIWPDGDLWFIVLFIVINE